MMKLSSEQTKIIASNSKNLLVIAGAGTGKTTVLTAKIAAMLKQGTKADNILAITFTRKAAIEMRERIKNDSVLIYTFDALCYKLIKDNIDINIIKDNIPFYQKDVLSFHLYDANLKVDKIPYRYDDYLMYKESTTQHDFNDIEYLALEQIIKKPLFFEYILVDEFQDTNRLQLEILRNLVTSNSKVFVVGDPDQSIYAFRGAYRNIFKDYINEYNPEILQLTNNYRSSAKIIEVANNLITNNKERIEKQLLSFKETTGTVKYFNFLSMELEAKFIIEQYQLLNHIDRKQFVVLYRNHVQVYELRRLLLQYDYKLNILSIHEAKGLEFDFVIIIGVNYNVFPANIVNTKLAVEEERRLMFVAITRSREKLYISSIRKPSLFIREIGLKHRP